MSNVLDAIGGWQVVFLLAFAAYRLARMFVSEDGPFDVFDRIRAASATLRLDTLLSCIYCTSVWTAAILLVVWISGTPGQVFVVILAIAGVACLPIKFEQTMEDMNDGES
jgi:hypothetical protein